MKYSIMSLLFVAVVCTAACNDTSTSSDSDKQGEINNLKKPVTIQLTKEQAEGQLIYGQKCASCHGGDGTAGIANAANLKISTLDMHRIAKTITDGRNGMPSFKEQVTKEQILNISEYVILLRK